jgi:protocatechuate 3,4-dioxygenase beta subunit
LPADFRGRFDAVLDYSADSTHAGQTDEQGAFSLTHVPVVSGASLRVVAEGYPALLESQPATSHVGLTYVLRRPRIREGVLEGVVLDAEGETVSGARVAMGLATTSSDSEGTFRFDLSDESSWNVRAGEFLGEPVEPESIVALKPGHLPGRVEPDEGGWPPSVVVRLGGPPLSIEGRVVDVDGAPLEGMQVWIDDPTLHGFGERGPQNVESLLSGDPTGSWASVLTDENGRFELEGLLDKRYRLNAMDPATLLRVVSLPIQAGDSAELRLPTDSVYERLRGKVVDRNGVGIEDVRVRVVCDAFRSRFRGQVISTSHGSTPVTVVTDNRGEFQLEQVPRTLAYLRLDGELMMPLEFGRDEEQLEALIGAEMGRVEIRVAMRCHFRLELDPESGVDAFEVHDASGEQLGINLFEGGGRMTLHHMPVAEVGTAVLGVSDDAQTMVLFAGGEELDRLPLDLLPGETVVVRY